MLKKCGTKWDCLVYEMLYIRTIRPNLNTQSDSISLLDNDVLETSKRRVMFYNILSQIFIVKCFTKSLLIRIHIQLALKQGLFIPFMPLGIESHFHRGRKWTMLCQILLEANIL